MEIILHFVIFESACGILSAFRYERLRADSRFEKRPHVARRSESRIFSTLPNSFFSFAPCPIGLGQLSRRFPVGAQGSAFPSVPCRPFSRQASRVPGHEGSSFSRCLKRYTTGHLKRTLRKCLTHA